MNMTILRLAVFVFFSMTTAFAQQSPVFAPAGKAIRGYDPVAYFADGKPVVGDSTLSSTYQGATWYFANTKNRDAFKANPDKYAPQYGGYCAYGTSQGHKAPTEADAWTINDGKLYLNYNKKVQTLWNKDRTGNIQKADTNWPTIKDKDSH
ncbi:YHS domain-containing (seleno)protein [Spirosoma areae]